MRKDIKKFLGPSIGIKRERKRIESADSYNGIRRVAVEG
jgi:hypothetical protein